MLNEKQADELKLILMAIWPENTEKHAVIRKTLTELAYKMDFENSGLESIADRKRLLEIALKVEDL